MTKIEVVSEKEQQKGVMSGFLALPYISRMLRHVRNSRGWPINASAEIDGCRANAMIPAYHLGLEGIMRCSPSS
jgi:hypothetical protein